MKNVLKYVTILKGLLEKIDLKKEKIYFIWLFKEER
jgi:hypothetical protein